MRRRTITLVALVTVLFPSLPSLALAWAKATSKNSWLRVCSERGAWPDESAQGGPSFEAAQVHFEPVAQPLLGRVQCTFLGGDGTPYWEESVTAMGLGWAIACYVLAIAVVGAAWALRPRPWNPCR